MNALKRLRRLHQPEGMQCALQESRQRRQSVLSRRNSAFGRLLQHKPRSGRNLLFRSVSMIIERSEIASTGKRASESMEYLFF